MKRSAFWLRTLGALGLAVLLAASSSHDPDPPVVEAAREGAVDVLRDLVRNGEDVNASQADGMTALHWAAERNDPEAARILAYAGAELEAKTRIGHYTPLLVASRVGNAEVTEVLLEAGADPDAATNTGGTPALHLAAMAGDAECVDLLLAHGAEIDARDDRWEHTPLIVAAAYGHADIVEVLLARGADPTAVNRIEDMAEREAEDRELRRLYEKRQELLEELAREAEEGEEGEGEEEDPDADYEEEAVTEEGEESKAPSEEDEPSEEAPDTAAAESEDEEDEEEPESLSYGELVGGYGGFSAIHLAAREGNREAVRALIDAGTPIDLASAGDHSTPLLLATINGHWDLAHELLERGADPKIASEAGATPLFGVINLQWAPRAFYPQPRAHLKQDTDYLTLMKALLEAGADPNARLTKHLWYMSYNFDLLGVDTWGATPFWRAAYATDVRAMKLLVEYGADPTIRTKKPAERRRRYARDDEDHSGLPPVDVGGPSLTALHAAAGAGYGEGYAANAHRHVPGGWLRSVKYLVEEHGLDVNARDHNGFTPLHHAAARGDIEVIEYLVEQNADVTAIGRSGHTVADMANGPVQRVPPYPKARDLLIELGSPFNDDCRSC